MPKGTTRSCVGPNSRDGVNCLSITQRNDRLPGMAHWLPTVAGSAEDAGMEPAAVAHRQLMRTPCRIPLGMEPIFGGESPRCDGNNLPVGSRTVYAHSS